MHMIVGTYMENIQHTDPSKSNIVEQKELSLNVYPN